MFPLHPILLLPQTSCIIEAAYTTQVLTDGEGPADAPSDAPCEPDGSHRGSLSASLSLSRWPLPDDKETEQERDQRRSSAVVEKMRTASLTKKAHDLRTRLIVAQRALQDAETRAQEAHLATTAQRTQCEETLQELAAARSTIVEQERLLQKLKGKGKDREGDDEDTEEEEDADSDISHASDRTDVAEPPPDTLVAEGASPLASHAGGGSVSPDGAEARSVSSVASPVHNGDAALIEELRESVRTLETSVEVWRGRQEEAGQQVKGLEDALQDTQGALRASEERCRELIAATGGGEGGGGKGEDAPHSTTLDVATNPDEFLTTAALHFGVTEADLTKLKQGTLSLTTPAPALREGCTQTDQSGAEKTSPRTPPGERAYVAYEKGCAVRRKEAARMWTSTAYEDTQVGNTADGRHQGGAELCTPKVVRSCCDGRVPSAVLPPLNECERAVEDGLSSQETYAVVRARALVRHWHSVDVLAGLTQVDTPWAEEVGVCCVGDGEGGGGLHSRGKGALAVLPRVCDKQRHSSRASARTRLVLKNVRSTSKVRYL